MDKSEPERRVLTRGSPVPHQQAMATTPKKLHIKTFGCQMNAYDSERMAEALADHGYAPTRQSAEADLVILNTCHIREKAAEKVYSELGRVRAVKQARTARGLDTMIAVAGCVAQAEGSEILDARASGRSRGRAAKLSSSFRRCSAACAMAASAWSPPTFPPKTNSSRCRSGRSSARSPQPSSPCRKAATNSARSASCPTRAAPNIRALPRRSSPRPRGLRGQACASSLCSGRM